MARRRARNARPRTIREGIIIAPIDTDKPRRVTVRVRLQAIAEDFAHGISPCNKEDWDLWLRYVKTHQATAKTVRVRVKKVNTDFMHELKNHESIPWHK